MDKFNITRCTSHAERIENKRNRLLRTAFDKRKIKADAFKGITKAQKTIETADAELEKISQELNTLSGGTNA